MTNICPVCRIGDLTEIEGSKEVQVGMQRGNVPFKYNFCSTCLSEMTTTDQMELNNRIMYEFKYACQKLDLDSELTLQGDYDYDY